MLRKSWGQVGGLAGSSSGSSSSSNSSSGPGATHAAQELGTGRWSAAQAADDG
jgi:hypothetical protein